MSRRLEATVLLTPLLDPLRGLDRSLAGRPGNLLTVGVGLLAGWWLYVPVHELLHAAGCVLAGGEVSRLEISPLYGGVLWAGLLPFVVAGGEYAGRLSGFDTRGSDWVYLATTFAPYLLTVFPGVWWLRRAGTSARPLWFGLALPIALAPFLSIVGDAYEIGSVLATIVGPWATATARLALRGDDLLRVVAGLRQSAAAPWPGLVVSAVIGLAWAFATYLLGAGCARLLGSGPVPPPVALADRRSRR